MGNEISFIEATCNGFRNGIETIKKELQKVKQEAIACEFKGVDKGEMIANLTLVYRHLEDARMRCGKVMQAYQGGISVLDKMPYPIGNEPPEAPVDSAEPSEEQGNTPIADAAPEDHDNATDPISDDPGIAEPTCKNTECENPTCAEVGAPAEATCDGVDFDH